MLDFSEGASVFYVTEQLYIIPVRNDDQHHIDMHRGVECKSLCSTWFLNKEQRKNELLFVQIIEEIEFQNTKN